MDAIAKVRKALIALLIAGGGQVLAALGDASEAGDHITSAEWWTAAGLAAAAFGAVFLVPNRLTEAQRHQLLQETAHQRLRGR